MVQMVLNLSNDYEETGNYDLCYYNHSCLKSLGAVRDFNHLFIVTVDVNIYNLGVVKFRLIYNMAEYASNYLLLMFMANLFLYLNYYETLH